MGLPVAALGQGAMTLSHNLATADAVDAIMQRAETAGGEVIKPAAKVFWGGYHGYVRAPDGVIWEFAHNPFSALSSDGSFCWNGYG